MGDINKMEKIRYFIDVERETKWLNKMSESGYRLIDKGWGTYSFMPCEKGEYCYYVEERLSVSAEENKYYRDFLQEMGIEMVTKTMGRFYFEKEADGKPFEIYTDNQSKIKFYIRQFPILLIIAISNMLLLHSHSIEPSGPWILGVSISYSIQIMMLAIVFLTGIKYLLKIASLKYQIKKDIFTTD